MTCRKSSRRAFTLVETLLAGGLLALLLTAALSLTSAGTIAFGNTAQSQYAELDITRSIRRVEAVLAEACDFTISADGQTITYYNYQVGVYPPKKDPTIHRFFRTTDPVTNVSNLMWSDEPTRPVLRYLTPLNDLDPPVALFLPLNGTAKTLNIVTMTLETKQDYWAQGKLRKAKQRAMVRVIPRNYSQTGTQ